MKKIRLGKTGLMVTQIGFGGIPIQRLSEEDAIAVVKRCLDLGVNYIDTANAYSTSEERIGKAITGRREGLIIATKTTARDREGVERHLKLSLERLGVSTIDLYQFHGVSNFDVYEKIIDPKGPLEVVQEAKKAGVIKHIGVTSHVKDVALEAVKTDLFESLMFPFNFVACEPALELLEPCREHDVGFIAMKPMGGGQLDNASLAFKYLRQYPDAVCLVGIERPSEIEEFVQFTNGSASLTEAEQVEIQRIIDEVGTTFCRRCDYCKPCTEEIPISTVMIVKSLWKRMPPSRVFVGGTADAMEKAESCTQCGDCEERCPYNLPIRDMIEEHLAFFKEEKEKYEVAQV